MATLTYSVVEPHALSLALPRKDFTLTMATSTAAEWPGDMPNS